MRLLRALVIGCALLTAGTANAQRVFDLDFEYKFSAPGVRDTVTESGMLTLNDDRTYVMEKDGGVFEGIWIQEKNNLQLFEDSESTVAEELAWLEQDASDFAGFPVKLTSKKYQEIAKFNRAGDLKVRTKNTRTYRPGLKGNSPLKMIWSLRLVGTLR